MIVFLATLITTLSSILRSGAAFGAHCIHGELLKLGINVGESSVSKYMVRCRKPPSQTWRTFLDNHLHQLVSINFFTVPTVRFQVLYVFLVLAHDRRRILHCKSENNRINTDLWWAWVDLNHRRRPYQDRDLRCIFATFNTRL